MLDAGAIEKSERVTAWKGLTEAHGGATAGEDVDVAGGRVVRDDDASREDKLGWERDVFGVDVGGDICDGASIGDDALCGELTDESCV